jgi:hypothetical protein
MGAVHIVMMHLCHMRTILLHDPGLVRELSRASLVHQRFQIPSFLDPSSNIKLPQDKLYNVMASWLWRYTPLFQDIHVIQLVRLVSTNVSEQRPTSILSIETKYVSKCPCGRAVSYSLMSFQRLSFYWAVWRPGLLSAFVYLIRHFIELWSVPLLWPCTEPATIVTWLKLFTQQVNIIQNQEYATYIT